MPYPYTGKMVHYTADSSGEYETLCRAAIVTNVVSVDPDVTPVGTYVDLFVMDNTGSSVVQNVHFGEDTPHQPGTWHEAEQVVS